MSEPMTGKKEKPISFTMRVFLPSGKEKAPIIIGIAILVAVLTTVISIVVHSYNENKSIMPDATYSKELSQVNLEKIKVLKEAEKIEKAKK